MEGKVLFPSKLEWSREPMRDRRGMETVGGQNSGGVISVRSYRVRDKLTDTECTVTAPHTLRHIHTHTHLYSQIQNCTNKNTIIHKYASPYRSMHTHIHTHT